MNFKLLILMLSVLGVSIGSLNADDACKGLKTGDKCNYTGAWPEFEEQGKVHVARCNNKSECELRLERLEGYPDIPYGQLKL